MNHKNLRLHNLILAFAFVTQLFLAGKTTYGQESDVGETGVDHKNLKKELERTQDRLMEVTEQMRAMAERLKVLESRPNSPVGNGTNSASSVQPQGSSPSKVAKPVGLVDLSDYEAARTELEAATHVLAKPWYENFHISGFASAAFLATGDDGTKPDGGFIIKETTLFVEAQVWEDISTFFEIQVNRLGKDDSLFLRTGEVYIHFRDVLKDVSDFKLGIKVGRIDLPFGEEYLSQDAIDNPLITTSASYPYGFDEGILFYGNVADVGWIVAITDGTDKRSAEDDFDKAINVKLYGQPCEHLYLSGSFMRNGRAAKSAFEFGGSHFQPIGASHPSSLAASPSGTVDALLYELDAKLILSKQTYISLAFGQAFVEDNASASDRDMLWFTVEAVHNITNSVYVAARYSEIGTYDSDAGYHFDGKITAGGNAAFGYDTKRFQRCSLGLGWAPNPHLVIKTEIGLDIFEVIDASTFTAGDDDRWFFGVEIVTRF